jgi:hypothetical protein
MMWRQNGEGGLGLFKFLANQASGGIPWFFIFLGYVMDDKKAMYSQIRIFGSSMFILLALVSGPVAGYFVGDFAVKRFLAPAYIVFVFIGLGFLSSVFETVRIARFLIKKEQR